MRRTVLLVFIVGLLVRLTLLFALKEYESPTHSEQRNVVFSLLEGKGYVDPFYSRATGPTAIVPPLYTFFTAGIFYFAGSDQFGEVIRQTLNASAAALAYATLPVVAQALGFPITTGITAALIGNLILVHYRVEFNSEAPLSALALVGLFLAYNRLWQGGQFTARNGVLHGGLWGGALLLAPSLLPIGLGWLGLAFLQFRRKVMPYAMLLASTAIAVLSPWAIRNALVLHSPIFLRSNLGLELQIANNEIARPTAAEAMGAGGAYARYHPVHNHLEGAQVLLLGEVEYNRRKLAHALAWMRDNPSEFVGLTMTRLLFFWFPPTKHPAQAAVLWGVTMLAFVGMLFAPSRPLLIAWLLYPIIYYLVHIDNRYRYPIFWTLILFSSVGLHFVIEKIKTFEMLAKIFIGGQTAMRYLPLKTHYPIFRRVPRQPEG